MMNPADTLTTLFRHNLWANERLIELCAGLSDEQLDATLLGTFGSIRDTLQHIVSAERSYFSRISTGRPYRRPADAPPLTLAEMLDWTRASGAGQADPERRQSQGCGSPQRLRPEHGRSSRYRVAAVGTPSFVAM